MRHSGRRPQSESHAPEIRARLARWKKTPESLRPSLRALARELDTSHQLLSHYLQRWERWQAKEYLGLAKEICARAEAENRSLTASETQQAEAYDRDAMYFLLESGLTDALRKLDRGIKQDVRAGRPPAAEAEKLLRMCASRGNPQAREILQRYFQRSAKDRTSNLPPLHPRAGRSFRCVEGAAGDSSKMLPRARIEIIGEDNGK